MSSSKDKRKIAIYTLAILAGLWMPISFMVNPGWLTLGLFYNPTLDKWLLVAVPLAVVLSANAFRSANESLPKGLFRLEAVFCMVWALQWIFQVNGSDTSDSLYAVFMRLFDLSGDSFTSLSQKLFVFTQLTAAILAAIAIFYRRITPSTGTREKLGWYLLMVNYFLIVMVGAVADVISNLGYRVSAESTIWYVSVPLATSGLLGILNIIYLVRYFILNRKQPIVIWLVGILCLFYSGIMVITACGMALFWFVASRMT